MELNINDLLSALQPTGLPDVILYQYYKQLNNNQRADWRCFT